MKRPILNRAVFIFSLLGVLVAGYLWYMHAADRGADIPCGGSHGCDIVAASPYARFPVGTGLPVALYGTLGYAAIAALAFLRTLTEDSKRDKALLGLMLLGAGLGAAASLWLTWIELFKIQAICRWCVGSQTLILLVLILTLTDFCSSDVPRPPLLSTAERHLFPNEIFERS